MVTTRGRRTPEVDDVAMKTKKKFFQEEEEGGEEEEEEEETTPTTRTRYPKRTRNKSSVKEKSESESESEEEEEEFVKTNKRRSSKRTKSPSTNKRVSALKPSKRKKLEEEGMSEEEEEEEQMGVGEDLYMTRSSATSTAKRCCASDGEGRVDVCAKVLAQACGLGDGSAQLLGEMKMATNQNNDEDDDDEEEESIYAEFAKSLCEHLSSEVKSSEGGNYDTLLFGKRSKNLESHFVHFWKQLVMLLHGKETLYSINEDGGGDGDEVDFLTCMKHVCVELSKSEVRSSRYAACVCGYALLGGLVDVHQVLGETNVLLTKQLRGLGNQKKNQQKRRDLNKRLQACHERSNFLDSHMMKHLFQELVIVRFRDVAPQIRALTIKWVGTWVVQHPKKFLSDGYLKYVAWSLNDKDARVRLAAVEALLKVYEANVKNNFLSNLDLLTQRFRGRFVELLRDRNSNVCFLALDLVRCLVENQMIDLEEDSQIGKDVSLLLLDDANKKVKANAGKLAACIVNMGREEEEMEGDEEDSLEKVVDACKLLDQLVVEGFAGENLRKEEVYVNALTAVVPHLRSIPKWELLAKACREDDEEDDVLLAIVRVTLACVKVNLVTKPSKKKGGGTINWREQYSVKFLNVLPSLLARSKCKKGSTKSALAYLTCELIRHLQIELFPMMRAEKDYGAMVETLTSLSQDSCLFTAVSCVRCLKHLAATGPATTREKAEAALTQLKPILVPMAEKFLAEEKQLEKEREEMEEEEEDDDEEEEEEEEEDEEEAPPPRQRSRRRL